MLTIHHLCVSQSDRIVWLCEELGVHYELAIYARERGSGRAPPEYRRLHAMEMAPVITEGSTTLAESGAIIEYLLLRHGHGRLQPDRESPNLADYLYWFHFANATLQPSLMLSLVIAQVGDGGDPRLAELGKRSARCLATVDARLTEVPYFAGDDFTAADVMMVFNLSTLLELTAFQLDQLPATRAYLDRIAARPAFRRAMKLAGDPQALVDPE